MATIRQMLVKSRTLTPNKLERDLFKFIKSIKKEILEKNKDQIQNNSEDVFGNPLGFYSLATEVISKGKKKKGDPFTGFETGDFFKGFYMQEVSGVLRFGSKDPKTNDILNSKNWLSDELFGLTDKNLKEVIQERLLPFFIENIRNKLEI